MEKSIKIKSKKIGRYVVELTTIDGAGGSIRMWEPRISELEHVWPNNADKTMHCIEEVHFMYQENAKEEYKEIKTFGDMVNLMRRNA